MNDVSLLQILACRAMGRSGDSRTKNAACVSARGIDIYGVNGPPGSIAMPDGEDKYDWFVHAEAAAIAHAAACGYSTVGMTMHALWASCPSCATLIAASGIEEVVTLKRLHDLTPERWQEKVATGLRILAAGGVKVTMFDGELGLPLMFNGEMVDL